MDNTQAFPTIEHSDPNISTVPGMLLIDYMAAKAMEGLLANGNWIGKYSNVANSSYKYAAAMLVEREKYIK